MVVNWVGATSDHVVAELLALDTGTRITSARGTIGRAICRTLGEKGQRQSVARHDPKRRGSDRYKPPGHLGGPATVAPRHLPACREYQAFASSAPTFPEERRQAARVSLSTWCYDCRACSPRAASRHTRGEPMSRLLSGFT
jgi:hypothetical protein